MQSLRRTSGLIVSIGTFFLISYVLVDGFLTPAIISSASSTFSMRNAVNVHLLFLSQLGPFALLVLFAVVWFVLSYLVFGLEPIRTPLFPR